MITSKQWWESVKNDPQKLIEWLKKQYHGEITAAERIRAFISLFGHQATEKELSVLEEIASQEENHARWVAGLLTNRGKTPQKIENKDSRYWDQTLPDIEDWASGCAVGAHAERMRLDRIRVICEDPETDEDIQNVFAKILPQEEFHERSFRSFSTAAALERTAKNHISGKNALGLSA